MPTETSYSTGFAGGVSSDQFNAAQSATCAGAAPFGYSVRAKTNDAAASVERQASGTAEASRKKPTTADRHALAEYLEDALTSSRDLEAAVLSADPKGAAIAGLDLRQSLRQLWRLRNVRSVDWATITNKLQVAISHVEFEQFTGDMANAVRMVIESHLGPDVDNDNVRAATVLLERNGLDPWKCIAGNDNNA